MRTRVALAVLIVIWLAASVGPATAQGCDDCREIKQELRGARSPRRRNPRRLRARRRSAGPRRPVSQNRWCEQ